MENIALKLLTRSHNVLTTIKNIVNRSQLRDVEKPMYAIKLLNLARQHNLLQEVDMLVKVYNIKLCRMELVTEAIYKAFKNSFYVRYML